jgi:hypothetical protein
LRLTMALAAARWFHGQHQELLDQANRAVDAG